MKLLSATLLIISVSFFVYAFYPKQKRIKKSVHMFYNSKGEWMSTYYHDFDTLMGNDNYHLQSVKESSDCKIYKYVPNLKLN